MSGVTLPDPQEIFGAWRPGWRVAGVLLLALAGASLWIHATVSPQWYESGAVPASNLAKLTALVLLTAAVGGAAIYLLGPWSERSAAKSPLIIGIDSNRLYLEGRGKLSGRTRVVELSGDAAFSDTGHYISDPEKLTEAVESALMTLRTRLKPFVFVMPFDDGLPRSLTKAQRQLMSEALSKCQVLRLGFIGHNSPHFDKDLTRRATS